MLHVWRCVVAMLRVWRCVGLRVVVCEGCQLINCHHGRVQAWYQEQRSVGGMQLFIKTLTGTNRSSYLTGAPRSRLLFLRSVLHVLEAAD
jgi:hypothetical protein